MDLKDLIIIDESLNATGTYKDRRSKYITEKAVREGVGTLCLITSGNAGFSLAHYAAPEGIRVVAVVDENMKDNIKKTLEGVCSRVISVKLNSHILKPEDVISFAREFEGEPIMEVTNGYSIAYEPIVEEIAVKNPDYLFLPVGSGEAYVGIYNGIQKYGLKTKMIGVGVIENPSFADKLATSWTPYMEKIENIVKEGHKIIRLSEEEIKSAYEKNKDKISCEPSSAVVWKGIELLRKELDLDNKLVAVLNSGKGLF